MGAPTCDDRHATYPLSALTGFYDRIKLPLQLRWATVKCMQPEDMLDYLELITRYMVVAVPFENLSLHYSETRRVSIDPANVYAKLVGQSVDGAGAESHPRGGYCMENNEPHVLNLITIPHSTSSDVGGTYSVDVGLGARGVMRPVRIPDRIDLPGPAIFNIPGSEVRYVWADPVDGGVALGESGSAGLEDVRPQSTIFSRAQMGTWVLQIRWDIPTQTQSTSSYFPDVAVVKKTGWSPLYSLSPQELFPTDYAVLNHFTSTSPDIWFTKALVCVRVIAAWELDDQSCQGPDAQHQPNHNLIAALDASTSPPGQWRAHWKALQARYAAASKPERFPMHAGVLILWQRTLRVRIGEKAYFVAGEDLSDYFTPNPSLPLSPPAFPASFQSMLQNSKAAGSLTGARQDIQLITPPPSPRSHAQQISAPPSPTYNFTPLQDKTPSHYAKMSDGARYLTTEAERIQALATFFDIRLNANERSGIRGSIVEIC